jgi:hypothetical protein
LDLKAGKRQEAAGDYVNRKFHKPYPSSNIIRVIKSRSLSWKGHRPVECKIGVRKSCTVLFYISVIKETDYLGELEVDRAFMATATRLRIP